MFGWNNSTAVAFVSSFGVALLAVCFLAPIAVAETARVEEPPGAGAVAITEHPEPSARYEHPAPEQQVSPQYTAPVAPEEGTPLGAGGPRTTEVHPEARYDPAAPISSDCGTHEDPCSSEGVADGVGPAAEDARSTDEALGEAHEGDAGLVEEARAADPPNVLTSGAAVAAVHQQDAKPTTPVGLLPARDNEVSSARTDETLRTANRPSEIPLSASGGSLILALGVGALLYRRFGR